MIGLLFLCNAVLIGGVSIVNRIVGRVALGDLGLDRPAFDVASDQSIPELFNYGQTLAAAGLLLASACARREWAYSAWALIFGCVAVDDAFQLHESFGQSAWALANLPTLPGLRPMDGGELVVWAGMAFLLFGLLGIALRTASKEARAVSLVLFGTFVLLVFFGVGVDMVHVMIMDKGPKVDRLLSVIEDGGEMMALASSFSVSLLLYRRN